LTWAAGNEFFFEGLTETVYQGQNISDQSGLAVLQAPTLRNSIRAGESNFGAGTVDGGASGPWTYVGNNETIKYEGQFFDADGIFAFGENIDDQVLIKIDGVEVLRNTAWNVPTTTSSGSNNTASATGQLDFGMGPNGDGWHDVEFIFGGGGGGNGAVGQNGWASNFGFGLNDNPGAGFTSNQGGDYAPAVEPLDGTPTLFRSIPRTRPSQTMSISCRIPRLRSEPSW